MLLNNKTVEVGVSGTVSVNRTETKTLLSPDDNRFFPKDSNNTYENEMCGCIQACLCCKYDKISKATCMKCKQVSSFASFWQQIHDWNLRRKVQKIEGRKNVSRHRDQEILL